MKSIHIRSVKLLSVIALLMPALFWGCKDSVNEADVNNLAADKTAMQTLIDEDSAISSFEPNFNEDDVMTILGKTQTDIYPFKVGHRMKLRNRNFSVDVVGDTAYGTLTKTFDGTLLIAASYNSNATVPDTVIKKSFTTTITKRIILVRVANTRFPERNWRVAAISLPQGGTSSANIDIQKLTAYLPNGDSLVITSPNDYFLSRGIGWWKQLPAIGIGQSITIRLEVYSAFADTDFVTLTYGADRNGLHRAKKKFQMISSIPSGSGFIKVYERTFTAHQFIGYYHAVINAFPRQVIFDDIAPVECESWGLPYLIKP